MKNLFEKNVVVTSVQEFETKNAVKIYRVFFPDDEGRRMFNCIYYGEDVPEVGNTVKVCVYGNRFGDLKVCAR